MKYVYTIKDIKAETCLPPFLASNDEQAKTMVAGLVLSNDPKVQICTHAEDFVLVRIEKWQEDAGTFSGDPERILLGNCLEIALSDLRRQKEMRAKIEKAKENDEIVINS